MTRFSHWIPLLVTAVLLGVSGSSAARMDAPASPLAFNSGNSSEMVTSLPVTKTGNPDSNQVVYCVDIGAVPPAGTIIMASSEVEVTNDISSYPPLVASQIYFADTCASTAGSEITETNGENCTNAQHHCTYVKSGAFTVTSQTITDHPDRHFVVLVVHAASGSYLWQAGDTVRVETDFGRLAVLVWPGI
jgi:hypothetical protein